MAKHASKITLPILIYAFATAVSAASRPVLDLGGYGITDPATGLNEDLCALIPESCPSGGGAAEIAAGTQSIDPNSGRPSVGSGAGYDIDIEGLGVTTPATDLNTVLCSEIPEVCSGAAITTATEIGESPAVMARIQDAVLISVKAVQVNPTTFFDVLLQARTDENGALEFQVLSFTAVENPGVVGASFSPESGIAEIPVLEVNQSTWYSMQLELVPGSNPITLRVVGTSML